MNIQNFPSTLLHSITTFIFIFIFIFITSSSAQSISQEFSNCTKPFRCGNFFQEITYPFWGGNRSGECGLPGFELRCQQNDFVTIDIANQTYRVVSMDQFYPSFTIARNDLWDDLCPQVYQSTDLSNIPALRYPSDIERINISYFCPSPRRDFPEKNAFTCDSNNNSSSRTGFFADRWFSSVWYSPYPSCELNITIPVLESAIEEFRNRSSSMTLQGLLNQGFRLDYGMNTRACSSCSGQCWSMINSVLPSCFCRDGPEEYMCSFQGSEYLLKYHKLISVGGELDVGMNVVIALGAAGIVLLVCFVFCFWCCKYKGWCFLGSILQICKGKTVDDKNLEAIINQYGSLTPRRYTYSEIKKMTNSFTNKLGQGGYGDVYKGSISNGLLTVAVKILKETKGNGEEFINEVASISRTSHVNIVTLVGFCIDGRKRALVYEFLSNGSLEKYIHKQQSDDHLGFVRLYEIALGIARGLEYLHRGCTTRILHFDIKPHNILLDEHFCPKISDFGLAKLCAGKESIVSMLEARGTIGYIAPEVFSRSFGEVSYKSDVYSYGMMVLEMVGGRKNAINVEMSNSSEAYFPRWIYQRIALDEDLKLHNRDDLLEDENEIAKKMIIAGLWCIQTDPSHRPTMSKVIDMLEGNSKDLEIPPKPFLCSPSRSESITLQVITAKGTLLSCPSSSVDSCTTTTTST